uniref:Uncharacterized protein n=1 Tax=Cyclopterus lumpus TaxID=8103 RepID=A0A8C2WXL9_CYCLU
MSYGSIDGGSFGSRNPFGGLTRQGYQPVATQVSPSELQDVFQETSSNIFQINANGKMTTHLAGHGCAHLTVAKIPNTRLLIFCIKTFQTSHDGNLQPYFCCRVCVCVCVPQSPQTPFTEQMEEGPLFGEAVGTEELAQAFLSEISEEDVEVLHQREEALLQIEVRTLTSVSAL